MSYKYICRVMAANFQEEKWGSTMLDYERRKGSRVPAYLDPRSYLPRVPPSLTTSTRCISPSGEYSAAKAIRRKVRSHRSRY